ncbi:hypothetical protein NC651_019105 [Populus alba x Populus x berolinensis]|nr:hypothetical protein NC651_019105 [Populus alba x Populus x berolinensis]
MFSVRGHCCHIKLERGYNGLVRRRPLTDADDCIKDGQFLSSMVSSEPFFPSTT